MTKIVKRLLLQLVNTNSRQKEVPLALKQLIKDINDMHLTDWIYNSNIIQKYICFPIEIIIKNTLPNRSQLMH